MPTETSSVSTAWARRQAEVLAVVPCRDPRFAHSLTRLPVVGALAIWILAIMLERR